MHPPASLPGGRNVCRRHPRRVVAPPSDCAPAPPLPPRSSLSSHAGASPSFCVARKFAICFTISEIQITQIKKHPFQPYGPPNPLYFFFPGNKLALVHVVCLGARRRVLSTHAFGASTLLNYGTCSFGRQLSRHRGDLSAVRGWRERPAGGACRRASGHGCDVRGHLRKP